MNIVRSVAAGRSTEVQEAAALFDYEDITNPDVRQIATDCARLAVVMIQRISTYGSDEELASGLSLLADARACFIDAKTRVRNA